MIIFLSKAAVVFPMIMVQPLSSNWTDLCVCEEGGGIIYFYYLFFNR